MSFHPLLSNTCVPHILVFASPPSHNQLLSPSKVSQVDTPLSFTMLFLTKPFLSCLLFALAANAAPVPSRADAFQEPDDARLASGGLDPIAATSSVRIEKRGKDKPPGPSSSSPSVENPLSPPSHMTVQWLPRMRQSINRKDRERLGQALADAGDRNVFIDKPVHTFFGKAK